MKSHSLFHLVFLFLSALVASLHAGDLYYYHLKGEAPKLTENDIQLLKNGAGPASLRRVEFAKDSFPRRTLSKEDIVVLDLCVPAFSHAARLSVDEAEAFKKHLDGFLNSMPDHRRCLVVEPYNASKRWKRIEHPLTKYQDIIRESVLASHVDFFFPQFESQLAQMKASDVQDADGVFTLKASGTLGMEVRGIALNIRARGSKSLAQTTHDLNYVGGRSLFTSGYLANYYTNNKRGYFLTKTKEGVCQYRIPSLLFTKKGTLIAAVNARLSTDGDSAHSRTAFRRSSDMGRTWSPITMDFPKFHGTQDTALVQDRETGRIFGLMIHKHEKGKLYLIHSDDDGLTWSEPDNIGRHFRHKDMRLLCPGPGTGLQTQSGGLVYSFYSSYAGKNRPTESFMIYSNDHGKTWKDGGLISTHATETQIAESLGGGLVAICRSNGQKGRMKNFFNPKTKRWSTAKPDLTFPMTSCQGSLISFNDKATGKHCTVYVTPTKGRSKGTAYLSYDGGQTWSYSRKINEGYFAYSSMALLPSGEIALMYEGGLNRAVGRQTEIILASFDLAWLVAGNKLP